MAILKDFFVTAIFSVVLLRGCLSDSLEQRLGDLEHSLKQLRDEINTKDLRIQNLEEQMVEKSAFITKLEERINILEMVDDINMDGGLNDKSKGNVSNFGDTMENAKRLLSGPSLSEENVAFHAYQKDEAITYAKGATLKFDIEVLDVGGGFNVGDSIFDVPVAGVYVFTWTIVPNFFNFGTTELVINGVVKGTIIADSDEIHDIHPATATVVAQVNKGDHVFIRRGTYIQGSIISSNLYARTTFSGWRLF